MTADGGKRDGAVAEWMDTTTFHGPNHARGARNKCECSFWVVLFFALLGVAIYQSYELVIQYRSSQEETTTISKTIQAKDLGEHFHVTLCPFRWLDRAKVDKAVEVGNISYANLLFALSLIESLDEAVLYEIAKWNIPDAERIWGIPKESCKNATTGGENTTPAPSGEPELPRSVNLLGNVVGGLVDTVTTVLDDTVGAVTNLLGGVGGIVGNLLGLPVGLQLEVIQNRLCNSSCRTDYMAEVDWKLQSGDFQAKVARLGIGDLTEFFAQFALDGNPLAASGGTRDRFEIHAGQLCQVMRVSGSNTNNGKWTGTGFAVFSIDEALQSNVTEATNYKAFVALPVSVQSNYRESQVWNDLKNRIGSNLPDLRRGLQPSYRIDYKEVRRILQPKGCKPNPVAGQSLVNPEIGYLAEECAASCAYENTAALGLDGYQLVTGSSTGRIRLDKKLAPGRFVEETLDYEGLKRCVETLKCDTLTYCEEWEVVEPTPVTSGIVPPPSSCSQSAREMLNVMHYSFRIVKASLVQSRSAMSVIDFVGMIGGILGLYIGSSILTLIHVVVHFLKRAIEVATGRGG